MSAAKIKAALASKGIPFEIVQYDRQVTPHGMMPGWTIQLTEDADEELTALGYDANPDCETAAEVMEWLSDLPDLRAALKMEGRDG